MTEQEYPAGNQAFVEHLDDAAPRSSVEVKDDVSAEDDVTSPDELRSLFVEEVHLGEVAEGTCRRRNAEVLAPRSRGGKPRCPARLGVLRYEPRSASVARCRSEGCGPVNAAA